MFTFCIGVPPDMMLYDLSDCIKLRDMGVSEVSLNANLLMGEKITRESILQLRENMDKAGLSARTSHPPFGSYNDAFSTIHQTQPALDEELCWMQEFLTRCGMLGVKAIPLHTGGAMLPDSQDWEIELAHSYVSALIPAAKAAGVKIAVENTNHARTIGWTKGVQGPIELDRNIWNYDDTQKILRFVKSFEDDIVGICYDIGHSHLLGQALEDMDAFKEFICLFHLHDNDGAYNDMHAQPGYYNLPWFELFDRMEGMNFSDIPLFIEARPRFGDLPLMLKELAALSEKRVIVGEGGFLQKDENTGRMIILDEEVQHA